MDYIALANSVLSFTFGGQAVEFGYALLYSIIAIAIVGWLALSLYLLIYEPHLLEKWKYPYFSSLSIILILSLVSFSVSFLFVQNLVALDGLLQNGKSQSNPKFLMYLLIMFIYIIFRLKLTSSPRRKVKEEYIPRKLIKFIPDSTILIFTLFMTLIGFFFLYDALNLPSDVNLNEQEGWTDWFGAIFILSLGLYFLIAHFFPKINKKIMTFIDRKIEPHRKLLLKIFLIGTLTYFLWILLKSIFLTGLALFILLIGILIIYRIYKKRKLVLKQRVRKGRKV